MTLKVLLAIRTAAIVATIVLLFVAWLVPAWNARFVIVARRVTVASGFGAQFAMTGIAVARGREPWTRFVIPIVGAILSIESARNARVADPMVARFLAVETTVMGAALRFLAGGFRQPLPAGFGFTKTASSLPLLLALPVFLIPSMVAVDIVIP